MLQGNWKIGRDINKNVYPEEYLEELGRKLYIKITEVIQFEVEEVTEQDCMDYIKKVVINRTFQGYQTEIKTIYGQLQDILGMPIEPATDEMDRIYNVDFILKIKDKYIGLQIKPITFKHTFEDYKWKEMQRSAHIKFQQRYGGKVFTIFSVRQGQKKIIANPEITEEIKNELKQLSES